ncbi:hypothetical protein V6N13_009571 [Hibiscus sabdariffa]|uniref:Uncharacterized protein n=1 Tax=Hibiscus sabdariffa TaxID=183260 RepID=A0ABR2A8E0_9ROSI
MEFTDSSPEKKQKQPIPPRRGQVKMRIIKGFLKSVTSMVSAKEMRSKMNEAGAGLSSSSTTPAPTPTTYDSD